MLGFFLFCAAVFACMAISIHSQRVTTGTELLGSRGGSDSDSDCDSDSDGGDGD